MSRSRDANGQHQRRSDSEQDQQKKCNPSQKCHPFRACFLFFHALLQSCHPVGVGF